MIDKGSTTETDAFVIVAGLGGGTGSGGAPVLANELSHLYTEPVYGVGILPAEDEGGIYNLNAAQSFQNLVESADNTILFDNDSWASAGDSLGDGYEMMNEELVKRLYLLFSAGEVSKTSEVGESVVDASEIINTLSAGGISTIGFSETEIPQEELPSKQGLLSRFKGDSKESLEDSSKNVNRITSLIRKAALGRLTHPIELQGIEKALVVVAGPPKLLNRKGVEKSRQWIENETETMEVRGGDYPIEGNTKMAGIVLLSGVTESDRIRELQRIGVEAKKRTKQIQENSEESLQDLLQTEENLGELTDE
jgi:cell division GTPase FtsZ